MAVMPTTYVIKYMDGVLQSHNNGNDNAIMSLILHHDANFRNGCKHQELHDVANPYLKELITIPMAKTKHLE